MYRVLNKHDKGGVLTSTSLDALPNNERVPELLSHCRSSDSHNGLYYSVTANYEYVLEYAKKNSHLNYGIAKLDIYLDSIPKEVVAIYPVMLREFWVSELGHNEKILQGNKIKDPYSGRERSVLGILQPSQQSISSWCSISYQVILQCNQLKMEIIEPANYMYNKYDHEKTRKLLKMLVSDIDLYRYNILSELLQKQIKESNIRNKYLLEKIPLWQQELVA